MKNGDEVIVKYKNGCDKGIFISESTTNKKVKMLTGDFEDKIIEVYENENVIPYTDEDFENIRKKSRIRYNYDFNFNMNAALICIPVDIRKFNKDEATLILLELVTHKKLLPQPTIKGWRLALKKGNDKSFPKEKVYEELKKLIPDDFIPIKLNHLKNFKTKYKDIVHNFFNYISDIDLKNSSEEIEDNVQDKFDMFFKYCPQIRSNISLPEFKVHFNLKYFSFKIYKLLIYFKLKKIKIKYY